MADPRLVQFCELHRTGDSIFDVIDLTENQNSQMLAWMLDPKEGHGQGDEILRDLMARASTVFNSDKSGVDGRASTAKFFTEWTPSRIRTSTFASAFTATELHFSDSERIDLCVVDTQNEFVLVIENKSGARHNDAQLERYREKVSDALGENPKLRGYAQAFIAMDRYFDPDHDGTRPSSKYWLHAGYDWLETSALRAQTHVERGNASAKLVATYCQLMTDWESPGTQRVEMLAAQLHQAYPEAIQKLLDASGNRAEATWLTSKDWNRAYMLFCLQNKSVIETLRETRGMASVMTSILGAIPSFSKDNMEYARSWLALCPRGAEELTRDGHWPVYIQVRYAAKNQSKFSVSIWWDGMAAKTPIEAARMRAALASLDAKFAKHLDALRRRVVVADGLSHAELIRKVVDLETRLSLLLQVP